MAESMFMIKQISKTVGSLLWGNLSENFMNAHTPSDNNSLSINLVTSWDKQCGIATYSAFLAEELKKTLKYTLLRCPRKMR